MILETEFPQALLRASLVLVASGVLLATVLRLLKPRAVWLHRLSWFGVLLSGLMLAPLTIELPWLESNAATQSGIPNRTQVHLTPMRIVSVPDNDASTVAPNREGGSQSAEAFPAALTELQLQAESVATGLLATSVHHGIVVWLAGMAIPAGFSVISWVFLVHVLRRCPGAAAHFQREADQVAAEFGLRRSVPLIVHESLGPMLCLTAAGYRVIVPEDIWPQLNINQRKAILLHELAHRQRHDVLKSLAVRLCALVHWFNPVAWWAARRFDEAAKWACDATLSRHPGQVAALASALLKLVERRKHRRRAILGVSAVQGASVCTRLRRLLDDTHSKTRDPIMKRISVLLVVALVFAAGALRFQLVAEPTRNNDIRRDRELHDLESWKHQAKELADQLDTNNNRLAEEFQAVLSTEPGLIVLQDRAGRRSAEARESAQANMITDMLAEHFDEVGDEYRPRSGDQKYREVVLKTSARVNQAIESMRQLLGDYAERFNAETEPEQMFRRFIQSDAAPVMLYMQTVRERIQPDVDALLAETDGLFLRRADGLISIHPARRDDAEARLNQLGEVREASQFVAEELEDWLAELTEPDDLHRSVRQTMQNPQFATMIVAWSIEEGADKEKYNRRLEMFFQQLEEFSSDTATGLILRDEIREEIQHHMQEFRRMLKSAEALRTPIAELAAQFSQVDELNKSWQKFVTTDLVRIRLATHFEGVGLEMDDVVRGLVSEVLEEADDGELRLRREKQEELLEQIRHLFREFRTFRRRARMVNRETSRISDSQLREAFTTWGGRIVLRNEVEQRLRRLSADGFALWRADHFEDQNGRLTLRPDAEESISDFLADVEAVTRELENDDFQRSDDSDDDDRRAESDR